jgi:signal transduction histidine kinase/ActR/RegA family two-component response regulator
MNDAPSVSDRRVLFLAPSGDGDWVRRSVASASGINFERHIDLVTLGEQLTVGAGAILLTPDLFSVPDLTPIVDALEQQPPWSDVPILFLCRDKADWGRAERATDLFGTVTVVGPPVHQTTLLSALRTALKARQRQYETRDYLGALHQSQAELAAELADTKRLHELGTRLLKDRKLTSVLNHVLEASIKLLGAEKGTIQLYDERTGELRILAQVGLSQEFLDHFQSARSGHSVCGAALERRERVIVEDVRRDPEFVHLAELFESFGYVAVQSTPLFGGEDKLLGILSTHFTRPHRPGPRELRLLDLYAQQAERVIERQRMAEDHYQRAAETQILLDTLPVGVLIAHDAGCRRITRNRIAAEMLQMPPESDLSDGASAWESHINCEIFHEGREIALHDRPIRRAARGEYVSAQEVERRFSDGSVMYTLTSAAPLLDRDCRVRGAVASVMDITRQKAAERELRELNATLERRVAERTEEAERRTAQLRVLAAELTQAEQRERKRVAQVLHDGLQQILVGARMYLESLHDHVVDPFAIETVKRVAEMIQQGISQSRGLALELSPPVLHDGGLLPALHWLARQMKQQALTVHVEASGPVEPFDETIRVFVFHAVRELLLNVVKHAQIDQARVAVTRPAEDVIQVEVGDAGVGFDPDHLDATRVEGFGLFSIRERLALLGGQLKLHAAPGEGTRAVLLVPDAQSAPRPAAMRPRTHHPHRVDGPAKPAPIRRARLKGGRIRVLVVDDHALVREGLADRLGRWPQIELIGQARDGLEAVDAALRTHPDVVLMDVSMPRLNGIEATRRIVAALPHVRIIGLSMHESRDMTSAMLEAGAVAYLCKSEPSDALMAAILHCPVEAVS